MIAALAAVAPLALVQTLGWGTAPIRGGIGGSRGGGMGGRGGTGGGMGGGRGGTGGGMGSSPEALRQTGQKAYSS